MRPTLTAVEDERVLEWLGKLFGGGLFDGRHRFELIAEGDKTRLVQSEQFSGLLVPFFKGMLRKTEVEFGNLNRALKARAEAA